MAPKIHWWISLWFAVTVPVIFWDAGYCFLRPRSMKGGDLHWIWRPYAIYQDIDYIYGLKALQEGDGFPNAQSLLNVLETLLNIAYLSLAHRSLSPAAPLVGFASATMTLSKTALYWLQEYFCSYCSIGHNSAFDLLVYWIIPNGLWLLVPSLIVYQLGKDISDALHVAAAAESSLAGSAKKKQ